MKRKWGNKRWRLKRSCIGRFRCSHWPSSATRWPKQQQWLRRSAARTSVDFQTWFSPLVQGGKYVVQKRETKAINKLCVREILSLSFVCGAWRFFEFRGRNLVCFCIAYKFVGGGTCKFALETGKARMRTAIFTRATLPRLKRNFYKNWKSSKKAPKSEIKSIFLAVSL